MEYRKLGRTGLKVSRLCLGTNMFGDYVDEAASLKVLDAAVEHGINFLDTSDSYARGASETIIGKGIKGRRQQVIVATKVVTAMGPGVNDRGASRKHIMDGVEASLRRLDTDYIDLYQIHQWDPDTPLEESLRALDDLVHQGKVLYIGCSNFAAWQLTKALWISDKLNLHRFESVQPPYNLVNRGIERELFPLCADQEIAILPYLVLMGGLFSGRYVAGATPPAGSRMAARQWMRDRVFTPENIDLVERIKGLAQQSGRSPTDFVLGWALAKPLLTSIIVGASRPEQVVQNVAVLEKPLSPEQVEACDKLSPIRG
ncbi:MAG: aldo/keto reductase [Chloroflexi bacterium]|nr:aldo/keto reductase [Chloroflexota bacterium]